MKKHTFTAKGAGSSIGGSHYIHNGKIAIDYGAIQDQKKSSYPEMTRENIELFLLSHDHLDHCGGVPMFLREYPESKALMTRTAYAGMMLQLRDSVRIAKSNAEIDMLRGLTPKPLDFDYPEVEHLIDRVDFVENTSWFEPLPGHKMSCRSAGHKPGAKMFCIVFPDGIRVLHACDVSLEEHALVRGAVVPKDFLNPDVMVVECTYGNRELPDRKQEEQRLKDVVKMVFERDGKVVIPHFASTLDDCAFPVAEAGFRTCVDGMGRDFTFTYANSEPWCEEDKPFRLEDMKNLFLLGDEDPNNDRLYRKELVYGRKPVVIVSSGGMLEGGPSVFYVEEMLEDARNAVIIPGYQASDTQGRKLLQLQSGEQISFFHQQVRKNREGKRELEPPWTETRRIYADVIKFQLSGHSGGDKMAYWINQINPKRVVTVHGEPESHEGLKDRIRLLNKNIDVISGKTGETIEFTF